MVAPFIVSGITALVSRAATASAKDKEMKEKLDLVKKLADLTPEQANAVDALKEQSVEEMKERVKHGVGPFGELPEKASEKAREARARARARQEERGILHRDDAAQDRARGLVKTMPVTEAERMAVRLSDDPQAEVRKIVDARMEEVRRNGR